MGGDGLSLGHRPVWGLVRYHGIKRDIMISMPQGTGQVRMPIGFESSQYEWLREYAHRRRVKMAAVVREALDRLRAEVDPQLPLPIEMTDSRGDA